MEKIMEVHDVFELPKVGFIAGGANPELDSLTREQICHSIPDKVLIQTASGKQILAQVIGVEVVSSILDKKNIHLRFDETVQKHDLEDGAIVYRLTNDEVAKQQIEHDAVGV